MTPPSEPEDPFGAKTDPVLWERATKDVKKLRKSGTVTVKPAGGEDRKPVLKKHSPALAAALSSQTGTDRKTEKRIRKGEMTIDARIDLHGHTANAAKDVLLNFIRSSLSAQHRCLLVITGKDAAAADGGAWHRPAKGIIRREFRQWLDEPPLKSHILSIHEAQPRHGGSGAFYIYLRRSRS